MATGGKQSAGFTIVETLIVLAVSSILAASALLLLNGRQSKTEFQVAANSMKQKLEQIINETANGYYPGTGSFKCAGATIAGQQPSITSTPTAQGTNNGCIFLGKAIAFGRGNSGAETYIVYPLAANRYDPVTGNEVASFADARPIALAPNMMGYPPVNFKDDRVTDNGLSLDHVQYIGPSGPITSADNTFAVIAIADALGRYASIDAHGTLNSATQSLDLYDYDLPWTSSVPYLTSSTGTTPRSSQQLVSDINASNIDETHAISAVQLCYASGGTNQSAQLTISGQGQLAVTLKVYEDRNCS